MKKISLLLIFVLTFFIKIVGLKAQVENNVNVVFLVNVIEYKQWWCSTNISHKTFVFKEDMTFSREIQLDSMFKSKYEHHKTKKVLTFRYTVKPSEWFVLYEVTNKSEVCESNYIRGVTVKDELEIEDAVLNKISSSFLKDSYLNHRILSKEKFKKENSFFNKILNKVRFEIKEWVKENSTDVEEEKKNVGIGVRG